MRRRGLGTLREGAGVPEATSWLCRPQCVAATLAPRAHTRGSPLEMIFGAPGQREAFGAEPQPPWVGKTY